MNTPPADLVQLAQQRAQARLDKDFARADELRDEIDSTGWKVVDTAEGFELVEKPPFDVAGNLSELSSMTLVETPVVICIIVDGWPDDVDTCLAALAENAPSDSTVLVVDCGNIDGAGLRAQAWADDKTERFRVVHLEQTLQTLGWSAVVSAAIDLSSCDVFALMDMSTVIEGDAFPAMLDVLDGDQVVATGWKGVNVDTEDGWRSFTPAGAGEVDAILGYLMAFKRDAINDVRPDPKARFYRNADMEWSLALREAGGIIVIPDVELPIRQDRHHGYHDSEPAYRDKQSKKTYDRILQRFRGKVHLLAPR
jgi:hypothetical protein